MSGSAVIEKYTENVRFCIIGNYLSKIIPALQSRCTRFRFAPLNEEQILPRLDYVIDQERLKVSDDGKKALMKLANGDMRKVLNVLQSTWMAYKDVTEANVYACVGHPTPADIEQIIHWLMSLEHFQQSFDKVQELKTEKGLALEDILREVHLFVMRIELPPRVMCRLLAKMARIERSLAAGCSERPQVSAFVAAFHMARSLISV